MGFWDECASCVFWIAVGVCCAVVHGWSPASLFYTWRAARSRIVFGFQDCVGIAVGLLIADFCAVLYGNLMGRRGLH
jgi:hypothetical protein